MHVDGKTAEGRTGALRPLRACPTTFASSDVGIGAVAITPAAVVEWLTCGAEIAVAFRLIREPLWAVERAVLPVDTVARSYVGSDVPIRQPLQELSVPVRRIRRHRVWLPSLPLRETCEHVLRGNGLLAHARCRRLHAHDHAAGIVDQIVVVVTEASRGSTLSRLG